MLVSEKQHHNERELRLQLETENETLSDNVQRLLLEKQLLEDKLARGKGFMGKFYNIIILGFVYNIVILFIFI